MLVHEKVPKASCSILNGRFKKNTLKAHSELLDVLGTLAYMSKHVHGYIFCV